MSIICSAPTDLPVPEFVRAPRRELSVPTVSAWSDALAMGLSPVPLTAGPDDLVRHALHLRHDRPSEGLHAHPPHA